MRRAGVLFVLVLLLGACGTSSARDGANDGASTTAADAAPDADSALLSSLALADDDLRDGETASLIQGGDEVAGQVTMDYCGATFETEAQRIARHQEQIANGRGEFAGGNEVVRYESGAAARAMEELRAAVDGCDPAELTESVIEGVPDARWASRPIDDDMLGDVAADHVGLDITITTTDGGEITNTVIFQRRGDVVIDSASPDPGRAVDLANLAGRRLAAVAASDIGA